RHHGQRPAQQRVEQVPAELGRAQRVRHGGGRLSAEPGVQPYRHGGGAGVFLGARHPYAVPVQSRALGGGMKRKGILIAGALIAVTGAGAFAAWLFHPEPGPAAPHIAPALPPSMGASAPVQSQAMLLRGQYLARAADCAACHTARGGTPYAGGLRMNTPFGAIHSTNITPHVVHGIGAYTYEEFDRAVRHGIRRDGKYLYPAMPYPEYAGISDEDMQALYAYFMNGVQPSAEANLDNALPWPFSVRAGLRAWNAWFKPPAPPAPDPGRDPDWRRGAYLV